MTVFYRFHPETKEFIGARVAPVDPIESDLASQAAGHSVTVYAQPGAFDTILPPPEAAEEQVAIFVDGAWQLTEDYRGQTFWTSHNESFVATELGPQSGTRERPTAPPFTTETLPPLTPVQLRLGLIAGGILLEQVQSVIDAIPDAAQRATTRSYWDYSLSYHRTHPLIGQLASSLGLSETQVNAMWENALTLG